MATYNTILAKINSYISTANGAGGITYGMVNELLNDINSGTLYKDEAVLSYSVLGHSHGIADVTGLQNAIDAKMDIHDHPYAALVHSHAIADTTGLQSAIDAKMDIHEHPYLQLVGGTLTGPVVFEQDVTFGANIFQNVPGTISYQDEIRSKDDFMTLRDGAASAITTRSGLRINKYNGTDSLLLAMNSSGWLELGDEGGTMQRIATISATASGYVKYNTTGSILEEVTLADMRSELSYWVELNGNVSYSGNVGVGIAPAANRTVDILAPSGQTALAATGSNGYILVDNVGSGENYYSANTKHVFQGGNVGIGTSTPNSKVTLASSLVTAGAYQDFEFVTTTGSNIGNAYIRHYADASSNFSSELGFIVRQNSANLIEAIRIKSDGAVGIGVLPADTKLDILSTNTQRGARITNVDNTNAAYMSFATDTGSSDIGLGGSAFSLASVADRQYMYAGVGRGISIIADSNDIKFYANLTSQIASISNTGITSAGTVTATGLAINGNALIAPKLASESSNAFNYDSLSIPDPTSINATGGLDVRFENPAGAASQSKVLLNIEDSNAHFYNFGIRVNSIDALSIDRAGNVGISKSLNVEENYSKNSKKITKDLGNLSGNEIDFNDTDYNVTLTADTTHTIKDDSFGYAEAGFVIMYVTGNYLYKLIDTGYTFSGQIAADGTVSDYDGTVLNRITIQCIDVANKKFWVTCEPSNS